MSSTKQDNLTNREYLNLGSCCISLMFFGSINCWNHILPIYLKRHFEEDETSNKYYIENSILQNSFHLSIQILIFSNLSKFFGTYFNKYLGLKNTLLISYFLLILSNLILFLFNGFFHTYISIILYSISNGISFLAILEEMWKIFPISRGLITGILNCSNNFGIFIFNPLYDYLQSDRIFLIINIIFFTIGCVSILFTLKIKKTKKKKRRGIFQESSSKDILSEQLNEEEENIDDDNITEKDNPSKEGNDLLKMLSEIF